MVTNHVNLLDTESPGPGQMELNYLSILIVLAAITLGSVCFIFWQKHNLSSSQKQLDAVTLEVTKLSAAVSSKHRKESNKDVLSKLNQPISWSGLLKEVARIIPASIQLSQVTGALSNPRSLIIMGNTHNLHEVVLLKNNLLGLPYCEKAIVTNLNQSTFQIECQIR